MAESLSSRIKNAWNAFKNRDPTSTPYYGDFTVHSSYRPDRVRLTRGNEKSIVTSIYNKIAIDVASIAIKHCKLDEDGRFEEELNSDLNERLTFEANKDQTSRSFIQDVVMSMFDEGCVAIVPVDTDIDPTNTEAYKILSWRTGKIVDWYPDKVKISVYNDRTGKKEDIVCDKRKVAIIENPLYSIVNEPNSTMQRLVRKLSLLDITDEKTASNKLDLIIQLPYMVKSETRQHQAKERLDKIEKQLTGKYGIAYIDGTEKITQLNRPIENNLLKQIEFLTATAYGQLGMTQEILNGSANEQTMLNYYTRTIEPIISAIVDEIKRKFLSKTARSQRQSIMFFRDPFKLVPVEKLADIADKFTRNEILSSNEIRQIVGRKPSKDPKADELRNSNMPQPEEGESKQNGEGETLPFSKMPISQLKANNEEGEENQNG